MLSQSQPVPSGALQLILHGKHAADEEVRGAVMQLRNEGADIRVRVTWEAGDARRFAREACQAGFSAVVAGGGDGTLNAVIRGVVDTTSEASSSVGLIPLGTANDFAAACQIPDDPLSALRVVLEGPARPVDVGMVNDHCFVNVATGGVGAVITTETHPDLKSALGGLSYLLTGLGRLGQIEALAIRVEAENFHWQGPCLVLAVGNGRQAGGGMPLCPEALLDDGLLEMNILPELAAEATTNLLTTLVTEGISGVSRHIIHARLADFTVHAADIMQVNVDGEPLQAKDFRFQLLPGRVAMHLPAEAPWQNP